MTKTVIDTIAVKPPARPEGLVLEKEIGSPRILTMGNIGKLLKSITTGDEKPLNDICLSPRQNEIDKRNRDRIMYQLIKWSKYGDEVDMRYNEIIKKPDPPPKKK